MGSVHMVIRCYGGRGPDDDILTMALALAELEHGWWRVRRVGVGLDCLSTAEKYYVVRLSLN